MRPRPNGMTVPQGFSPAADTVARAAIMHMNAALTRASGVGSSSPYGVPARIDRSRAFGCPRHHDAMLTSVGESTGATSATSERRDASVCP
jgi:hypothetical protein